MSQGLHLQGFVQIVSEGLSLQEFVQAMSRGVSLGGIFVIAAVIDWKFAKCVFGVNKSYGNI